MTNNWQFTSLKTSKRLAELGVESESMMCWYLEIDSNEFLITDNQSIKDDRWEWCSAFSSSELGEILPTNCKTFKGGKDFYWACEWKNTDGYKSVSGSSTMAEAMGLMLIFLKEQKLI